MKPRNQTRTALTIAAGILLANAGSSNADLIDGLVEYWEFDGDYSAGITEEHVGTLQAKGTGLTESGFVPGKFGQGIDLESSDVNNQASVVIGGDENDFDFTGGSMSLSIWYTTESLYRDWQTLAGKGENGSWRLARNRTTPSQLKISLWLVGEGELDQQDGSWHHAVAVVDVSGHFLYVDGNLVASNANPGNIAEGGLSMQIGGNPQAANRGWDGIIDDVAIWDRALTADEVTSIWNDGNGASIANLIGLGDLPFRLSIANNGANLDFEWGSQAGMLYNLKSSTDLAADLSTWDLEEGDIPATPSTNLKTIVRPGDLARYYRVEEFPAPPVTIFSDDFESDLGWTASVNDANELTNWQRGAPSGVGPTTGANGSATCFGTNLASDYEFDANISLRSPAIDLTGAGLTKATLTFQHFPDIEGEPFDNGTIRVLMNGTVTQLGANVGTVTAPGAAWAEYSADLPPEALGQMIQLEFLFTSDDVQNLAGWYIDDVLVTTSAP